MSRKSKKYIIVTLIAISIGAVVGLLEHWFPTFSTEIGDIGLGAAFVFAIVAVYVEKRLGQSSTKR